MDQFIALLNYRFAINLNDRLNQVVNNVVQFFIAQPFIATPFCQFAEHVRFAEIDQHLVAQQLSRTTTDIQVKARVVQEIGRSMVIFLFGHGLEGHGLLAVEPVVEHFTLAFIEFILDALGCVAQVIDFLINTVLMGQRQVDMGAGFFRVKPALALGRRLQGILPENGLFQPVPLLITKQTIALNLFDLLELIPIHLPVGIERRFALAKAQRLLILWLAVFCQFAILLLYLVKVSPQGLAV